MEIKNEDILQANLGLECTDQAHNLEDLGLSPHDSTQPICKNEDLQSLDQKDAMKIEVQLYTFSCDKCDFKAKNKSSLTRHQNKTGHRDPDTATKSAKNNRKEKKSTENQVKIQSPTKPQKKEKNTVKTNVDLVNGFKQDIFCEFLKEKRVIQQSIKLKEVFKEWMVDKYPNIDLDIDFNDDFMKQLEVDDRIEGIIGPSGRYCWVTKSENISKDVDSENKEPLKPQDTDPSDELLQKCCSENLIFVMKDAINAILLRHKTISAPRLFDSLMGFFPAYKTNSNMVVMRMLYVLNHDNDFVKKEETDMWTGLQHRDCEGNIDKEDVFEQEEVFEHQSKRRKIESDDNRENGNADIVM